MGVERFPVEEGTILFFARAIGDTNPIYSDPAYAATTEVGGIIAPPTYIASGAQFDPDYRLRPKPGQKWFGSGRSASGTVGSGDERTGAVARGLHAEQEYTYHRHLRPGEVLSSTVNPGTTWAKQGRSGRLVFTETVTEWRDQHGELVVTARGVGVVTEGPKEGQ